MLSLIKYLKNFIFFVFLIIVFLVVQALCELALPDYTAEIVNVGIQQGGVKYAVPGLIRETEMNKLFLFIEEESQNIIRKNYTLTDTDNLSESDYPMKNPPGNGFLSIYELNNIDSDELDELKVIFSDAFLILSAIEQNPELVKQATEQLKANFPEGSFPDDASFFDIFSVMTSEQRENVLKQTQDQMSDISNIPENIAEQAAITAIKNEYVNIGIDTGKIQSRYILSAGLNMLLITLLSVISAVIVTLFSAKIAAGLGRNLRSKIFNKVVSFSNTEYDKFSTASLITRSTNDIQQIQMMMTMLFRVVIFAPIMGIGGVLKVLNTNSMMSWVIAVAVLAIFTLIAFLFIFAMPKFKKLQTLVDKVNLVTREILTGLPVIRAFNNAKHEEKRFDSANKDLTKIQLFVSNAMAFMMPTMMFIMNAVMILIIWVGAGYIDEGTMQVGDMMAFMQYAMQILMSFLMISIVSIMLPRAAVSAKRITEVIETEVTINDPERPKSFNESRKGYVEFKDVCFRYPNAEEDVLSNISFTAKPGETTAIIGSTGSGKSTIVNLIPRFYDVTGGEILIDGVNIQDVTQYNLRNKLGFVPQKGILFSGTIESNIKYGNSSASEEEVERAAEIAQAVDFINEKPDKYQSEISQGGTNVSGGQRQRLSVARAIAGKPEIYIFDDSFSALDFKTDVALRKALKTAVKESTVIIVAQRISTILHAEQIIVLDEGRIVGKGTHKELMQNCDVYSQIALSQLSKEELNNEQQ